MVPYLLPLFGKVISVKQVTQGNQVMNDPLALAPGNNSAGAVPALPKFVNRDGQGNILAQSTAPEGTTITDVRWYWCDIPTASMHRKDGKRLTFINKIFFSSILEDQRYLDNEILDGNSFLRLATADEIENAKMQLDPKGTMKDKLIEELADSPEKMADLERQINEMRARKAGVSTDEQKIAGSAILAGEKVRTDTATVVIGGGNASQSFQAAVVGSDKVVEGAASGLGGLSSLSSLSSVGAAKA